MPPSSILIVEDEIIIARELEARLTGLGYRVVGIASTGTEAIRLTVETQPALVLMDIVLKGNMDGVEAATEIRRRCQVPVIFLTAYTDKKTLDRAKVTEPYAYIVKPFSERELYANIEMALYKHKAETRLRQMERWFAHAMEVVPDAVIASNGDRRITIFNQAVEAITGWQRDQVIGRNLHDVFRLVQRDNGQPISLEGVHEGPVVCLGDNTLLLDKADQSIPVANTTSCLRDAEGQPTGMVSIFRDLSGKRHGGLANLTGDVALAASQALTLRAMLQLCCESMVRNLHVAFARVWTLAPGGDMLLLQASAGQYTHLDGPHARVPVGQFKIGKIAQSRKPHLTNYVQSDPLISDPAWARREGMVAFTGYPLLVEDRLVGVLGLFARRPLHDSVLDALAAVAQTIAVGIERKQAEEALRTTRERLEHVLLSSPAVIYSLKLAGENVTSVWVSENIHALFGYPLSATLQPHWWLENLHPDDRTKEQHQIQDLLHRGQLVSEYRFRHHDGTYRWIHDEKRLLRDAAGQPVEAVGSWTDITERKQAEDELRRSEERYRSLFKHNPLPMWVYDLETLAFRAVNEAAVRKYGYSREEFLGMTLRDIRPEEDLHRFEATIRQSRRTPGPTNIWRHRKKDGTVFNVEITSHDIQFEAQPARLVLAHDVTERERSEALRNRLTAILEATTDLVAILQPDGKIVYLNHAGRALLEVSTDVQLTALEPSLAWSRNLLSQESISLALRKGTWSGETHLHCSSGHAIAVSQVIIAHNNALGELEFLSTIVRDIRAQRVLEEQYRQAQKMEAVGQLAGGVAHDFNNLLTIISGYSDILLAGGELDEFTQGLIREVRQAGERAAGLTRQLLAFSRKQVLDPKVLALNPLITNLEKMLHRLIGEDVSLALALDPHLAPVVADEGQIEQVIMNLVVNARDAMPQGGQLTIETKNVVLTEDYVRTHVDAKLGSYVLLAISDTGAGMTPDIQCRIFEPFFTTKGVGKGTGLGLATVYGIVKQSGGHVSVYSEPGIGTTFKVYLPRSPLRTAAATPPPADTHLPQGTVTILLVEDEAAVRTIGRLVLRNSGYTVLEAGSGDEALQLVAQHQGPLHLLVTDVVMPGISGRGLAEQLTALRPELKVLYVSGYTDDAIIRHGILQADVAFLQKPFTPVGLAQKVRAVLDQPAHARPQPVHGSETLPYIPP